ncbi:MAG: isopenicillin N synthase family dioxygenase [Ilumatobacter sp.]
MANPSFDSIPVVDLTASTDDELAAQLCSVCHEVGFLLVTNHGVDHQLVDDVFEMMHRFFALDVEHKLLIDKSTSPHFRGWEPVGSEFTNDRVDVREQIDMWSQWPVAPPSPATPPAHRLLGPNPWMPDDVLAGHEELTLRWMYELGRLADRLLGLLALGLGLASDHFAAMFGAQPMSLTKMIRYPPTPASGAGVNAHHDTGFLTLLAPGPTAGLEVQNPDGDWIDVPTVPGTFVVNLGEMLQAMTGNYFVATPHRVIAPSERLSAAYFHGPSLDTPLTPIDLGPSFTAAVHASERHRTGGYMASSELTQAGVGDMESELAATTYGEQLWNYFRRSYPANMARHHPELTG